MARAEVGGWRRWELPGPSGLRRRGALCRGEGRHGRTGLTQEEALDALDPEALEAVCIQPHRVQHLLVLDALRNHEGVALPGEGDDGEDNRTSRAAVYGAQHDGAIDLHVVEVS